MPDKNIVRIIGGAFKGRKIAIVPNSNIRPTADRVRETLFNWLMHDIQNSRVLDLFTGSGAIGIEALSRGAAFVYFNDKNPKIIDNIAQHLKTFQVDNNKFSLSNQDTLKLLEQTPQQLNQDPFDIIILDPPFNKDLVNNCLDLIIKNNWLNLNHPNPNFKPLVYLEAEVNYDLNLIDSSKLRPLKQKTTGNVLYSLFIKI